MVGMFQKRKFLTLYYIFGLEKGVDEWHISDFTIRILVFSASFFCFTLILGCSLNSVKQRKK